jgi:hypothetical protein
MARPLPLALLAVTALSLAPVAQATIARAVKFDDKVEKAASIVLGTCVAQESRRDEASGRILTYSTFQVEKTLKGQPAQQITLVTPGGTVGNIAQHVVGVPEFRKGAEHVVFVRNTRSGPTVLFLDQGAYRVESEGSDRMVRPLVSNAVLVDTQRGMAVAPEQPRRLRDFEDSVRQTIRRRDALRMDMIERQKRQEASLWNQIQRNKALVALALLGVALATWQLVRRH